jgi:hypothetical protein
MLNSVTLFMQRTKEAAKFEWRQTPRRLCSFHRYPRPLPTPLHPRLDHRRRADDLSLGVDIAGEDGLGGVLSLAIPNVM